MTSSTCNLAKRFSPAEVGVAAVLGAAVLTWASAAAAQPPGPPGSERTAAVQYLQEIAADPGVLASYRGTATLRAYGDAEGTYNAAFARAQPDRGRFEMSTPLTGTALVVTAGGGELLTYYPGDGTAVVSGDAARSIPAFSAGEAGGFSDSLDLLAGRPPLYEDEVAAGDLEIALLEGDDGATLTWLEPGGARLQRLMLAGEPRRPVNVRFYEDDAAAVDVAYDDWRECGGAAVPFAVTVKTADTLVEISVKSFEANVDIPEEAFSTAPPAGVEVREARPAPYGEGADDEGN